MDKTLFMIAALTVALAVLVVGIISNRIKLKLLVAEIEEDLMNTYTPEIMKHHPRFQRKYQSDETSEIETGEVPKEG